MRDPSTPGGALRRLSERAALLALPCPVLWHRGVGGVDREQERLARRYLGPPASPPPADRPVDTDPRAG